MYVVSTADRFKPTTQDIRQLKKLNLKMKTLLELRKKIAG
jgi:hypothetical protein